MPQAEAFADRLHELQSRDFKIVLHEGVGCRTVAVAFIVAHLHLVAEQYVVETAVAEVGREWRLVARRVIAHLAFKQLGKKLASGRLAVLDHNDVHARLQAELAILATEILEEHEACILASHVQTRAYRLAWNDRRAVLY